MEYKGKKRKLTLAKKKNIAELKAEKAKYEEDKNNPKVNKSMWSENKRKWVNLFTQKGYINHFAREYFVDLKNEKSDLKEFERITERIREILIGNLRLRIQNLLIQLLCYTNIKELGLFMDKLWKR